MLLVGPRIVLERITPELARRIVARDERPEDRWHPDYPMADELDPLGSLASNSTPDADFTMYIIRMRSGGLAVGGIGFFGCPDGHGRVEFGYGLVPSARGQGLASEAVQVALDHAARKGATVAVAETETSNIASQRVLTKAGFTDVDRNGSLIRYERGLLVR